MTARDEARQALDSRDWSDSSVETRRRPASSVLSVRVDADLADWIGAEAKRRGMTPSAVIRDAVIAARASSTADQTVTMRLSDLHSAINTLVHPTRPRAA